MERLRYVARAGAVPMVPLVREAASALGFFADDPMGLLTACRRLLDRRRDCGPLVWLAARMVSGLDPRLEAAEVVAALESDPTAEELMGALAARANVLACAWHESVGAALDGRPDCEALDRTDPCSVETADLVVIASDCAGPSGALVPAECVDVAELATASGTPVWLVAGVGRVLPEPMWKALGAGHGWDHLESRDIAMLELDPLVTEVVTPSGLRSPAEAAQQSDFPVVPELFTP